MSYRNKRALPTPLRRFFREDLTPILLTFCLISGAIFSLATAFSLRVNTAGLLLAILGLSLFWLLLRRIPKSWWIVRVLLAAGAAFVLFTKANAIILSLQTVYTTIRSIYDSAYNFGLPLWFPKESSTGTLALFLPCIPLTLITVRALRRQKSVVLPLLLDSIPLFLCFVVIDTPPASFWRNLFLITLGVIMLSQVARRLGTNHNRLVLIATPVMLALVLAVQGFIPREDYRRSDFGQTMLSTLLDWTSQFATINVEDVFGELDIHVPVTQRESLEIGPRNNSDRTLLEVRSQTSGSLYLRGMTYSVYTGNAWVFLEDEEYKGVDTTPGLVVEESANVASIAIRTRYAEPTIFTPYYLKAIPGVGAPWVDVCVENTNKLREYALVYYPDLSAVPAWYRAQLNASKTDGSVYSWGGFDENNFMTAARPFHDYDRFVYRHYTALPPETQQAALDWIADMGLNQTQLLSMNPTDAVSYISEAVRNSAEYDLNTAKMPAGRDFVIWFLRESDTGYCVHFASATTVLLRSLGIPSRYVTGYLVDTEATKWTPVSAQHAHAWAEYYVPGLGWLPIESTPGNEAIANGPSEETEPVTSPTEETTPDPTRPENPTEPTMETRPQPTETKPDTPDREPDPNDGDDTPRNDWWKTIHIPGWVWWCAGLLAIFFLQRPVRLKLWQRHLTHAPCKTRFLIRWRRGCRLAELLKESICHEDLAEKARFSAHDPTLEEETLLSEWELHLQKVIRTKPWYCRFLCHWILVWS